VHGCSRIGLEGVVTPMHSRNGTCGSIGIGKERNILVDEEPRHVEGDHDFHLPLVVESFKQVSRTYTAFGLEESGQKGRNRKEIVESPLFCRYGRKEEK
jgi:hypothetical protein